MHLNKSKTAGHCVYSYQYQRAGLNSTPAGPLELNGPALLMKDCRVTRCNLNAAKRLTKRTVFIHINGQPVETKGQRFRIVGQLTVDPRGKFRPEEFHFVWAKGRSRAGDAWPHVLFTPQGTFVVEIK